MVKTKVYFWLKVDKKFFENIFIKRLKSTDEGYKMTVIYIRLMLESLESDCVLYYEGVFENLVEELSLKLDVSEDDIKTTVDYFEKVGLIQIDEDGNARMEQAIALKEQETNWAKYKREQRKLESVQPLSNNCPTDVQQNKSKSKNKNKSKSQSQNIATTATADLTEKEIQDISSYYQSRIGVLDGHHFKQLMEFLTIDKMELELLKRAIDKSANNSKRNFGYVNAILRNWAQNGIKTIVQQDEEERTYNASKNKGQGVTESNSIFPDDINF